LDHFLYEDSEENSDSDEEFLGFHEREDSEVSDSDLEGFKRLDISILVFVLCLNVALILGVRIIHRNIR
jgi:hypothetical protein